MPTREAAAVLSLILAAATAVADPPRVDTVDPLPDGACARLGTTRWRIPGPSRGNFLTPDGRTIITDNSSTGQIVRIDARTGRPIGLPVSGSGPAWETFLLSRDGRTLVNCRYQAVAVVDLAAAKQVSQFMIDNRPGSDTYALADGGRFLAATSRYPARDQDPGKAVVWDLTAGKAVASVEPLQNQAVQAALSPDGKLLATFGHRYDRGNAGNGPAENPNSIVQIWDVATGKEKARVKTGEHLVGTARFSPDGNTLVTAGYGAPIQAWDVVSGKPLRQFPARSGQGQRLFFSPDGKQLASTGSDGSIQLWETATGRRLGVCESVVPYVSDVAFPPSGPPVALGRRNNALVLWTIPDGKRLTPEGGHSLPPGALQFSPDGKTLLSFESEGRILHWDVASGKELVATPVQVTSDEYRGRGRQSYYYTSGFSPSARWLVLANNSGVRSLYDVKSGTELYAFTQAGSYPGNYLRVCFSADESRAAVVSVGPNRGGNPVEAIARVWGAESGQLVAVWPLPWMDPRFDSNCGWALSPNGARLVVAGMTRSGNAVQQISVGALDVATGKVLGQYACPSNDFQFPPVVGPDNRSVLLAGPNGQAVVWDLLSGAVKQTTALDKRLAMIAPRLSANGRFVVMVAYEPRTERGPSFQRSYQQQSVVVLEWASGEKRFEFPLPDGQTVSALALSPDGGTLAAGCSDTTILLYDIALSAGLRTSAKNPSAPDELWKKLATGSAATAWQAMRELIARPDVAVPLLRERLRPAAAKSKPDPAAVSKWIAQLDATSYAERAEAERQLVYQGDLVAVEVRAALEKPSSPEARQRLTRIAAALDNPVALSLADARALELLEAIGSKGAADHLRALAAGGPTAALTREAKITLERVTRGASKSDEPAK